MLVVKTFVAASKIHGLGIFAGEPIKAGAQVWIPNPTIDVEIKPDELAALPSVAREAAIAHSFVDEDGRMILSRDNAVFFNHSDKPNTGSDRSGNYALWDIAVGEELTEDYRAFGDGGCKDFLNGD